MVKKSTKKASVQFVQVKFVSFTLTQPAGTALNISVTNLSSVGGTGSLTDLNDTFAEYQDMYRFWRLDSFNAEATYVNQAVGTEPVDGAWESYLITLLLPGATAPANLLACESPWSSRFGCKTEAGERRFTSLHLPASALVPDKATPCAGPGPKTWITTADDGIGTSDDTYGAIYLVSGVPVSASGTPRFFSVRCEWVASFYQIVDPTTISLKLARRLHLKSMVQPEIPPSVSKTEDPDSDGDCLESREGDQCSVLTEMDRGDCISAARLETEIVELQAKLRLLKRK